MGVAVKQEGYIVENKCSYVNEYLEQKIFHGVKKYEI